MTITGQELCESYLRLEDEIAEARQKIDHYKGKLEGLRKAQEDCIRDLQKLVGDNIPTKAFHCCGRVVVVELQAPIRVLKLETIQK